MDNFLTLFDLIGVLAHRRYQSMERNLSTIGLNHTEARLLIVLHQKKGVATQDDLSNFLFVDRSNTGRALKQLEDKGHTIRKKDVRDGRTNLVNITKEGQKAVAQISKLKEEVAQGFFHDLKEDEAGKITELLKNALTEEEYNKRSNAPGTNGSQK